LICIRCHDYRETDVWGGVLLYLLVPCHLFIAWLIEKFAAVKARSALGQISKAREDGPARQTIIRRQHYTYWYIAALAHSVNALYLLRSATLWVYYDIHHPGIGTLCELHAIIICFKVCSYAFTNRDLRRAYLHPDVEEELPALYAECPYPNNITFRNLLYFWWAPTLIYQPVYPRRPTIRWWYVARCGAEIFVLGVAVWIASAQYATPLLQNSLDSIFSLDLVAMAERTMKLSTISVFCWLCGFYALFQSALNALAEIMQFGDRDFYGDWWNVSSVRTYWTSWNKPVTNFMRRHVYSPLVGRGVPPWLAQVIVFLISGVLHELLVGVPTHNILCKLSFPP
jgi:diacylglycerol O-acyltransferase-1